MKMIIIDGSDDEFHTTSGKSALFQNRRESLENESCRKYVRTLRNELTAVVECATNIGHGRGMDMAIRMCTTRFALIFDSDIEMVKSPVQEMLDMMEEDTFGVGYLEKTGFDGYEYGAKPHHHSQGFMMMMHPFFHLVQIPIYAKYHPYVQHGAPCYKTAFDIHRRGLSDKILKVFPGLGHTGGRGWCWEPVPGEHIKHRTAGTREFRRKMGKPEIEQDWDYTPLPKI